MSDDPNVEERGVDRDLLIQAIGSTVIRNRVVAEQDWARYALVARFHDDRIQLNGWAYDDDGAARPATPNGVDIHHQLQALHDNTAVDGEERWEACVLRIDVESSKLTIEFVYDDVEQWDVTPTTADAVADRARPG